MTITRDQLYEAAFKYRKTGLWKKLWDNEIFAVRLNDGETGYICTMGKDSEFNALGVFVGDEGFNSYRKIEELKEGSDVPPLKGHEIITMQTCLQVEFVEGKFLTQEEREAVRVFAKKNGIRLAGKNAFPHLTKFEPRCVPWEIKKEEDLEVLYTAIKAATLLADMLKDSSPASVGIMQIGPESTEVPLFEIKDGEMVRAGYVPIPGEIKEEYEYVNAENEIILAAVRKLPKRGIWEAELVCALEPVRNSPEETPYYPFMLMLVNREDYFVLPMKMIDHVEKKPQELLQEYANAWRNNHVYPMEIRCRDERTYALLKDFSEKTGAGISIYDGELSVLDEVEQALIESPLGYDEEEILEEMDEIIHEILTMPEEKLMTMPTELQEYLWSFIEGGVFPEIIAQELRKRMERIQE